MKITLSEIQIAEIAENLECGMRALYNTKTGEVKTIPNTDIDVDDEYWGEELTEIDENWMHYFEFENMDSRESFRVMSDFTESVSDLKLKSSLIAALEKSKPFRHFKDKIDYAGEYRDYWFKFKHARYINWVQEQIDRNNMSLSIE